MHEPSPQPHSFISNRRNELIHRDDSTLPPDRLATVIESQAFKSLLALGCSREILRHALHRFAMACSQPTTARGVFKSAGLSQKQLQGKITAAEDLRDFIRRLQMEPRIALANNMPTHQMFRWRGELVAIAEWIKQLEVFHPDPIQAVLALVLHVKKATGKRSLKSEVKNDILDLLEDVRDVIGAKKPMLTLDSFEKALRRSSRADRTKAENLLLSWESFQSL